MAKNASPFAQQVQLDERAFRDALISHEIADGVTVKRRTKARYGAWLDVSTRPYSGAPVHELAREMFKPPAYRVSPLYGSGDHVDIKLRNAAVVHVGDAVEFETGEGRVRGTVTYVPADGEIAVEWKGIRFAVLPDYVQLVKPARNRGRRRASRSKQRKRTSRKR